MLIFVSVEFAQRNLLSSLYSELLKASIEACFVGNSMMTPDFPHFPSTVSACISLANTVLPTDPPQSWKASTYSAKESRDSTFDPKAAAKPREEIHYQKQEEVREAEKVRAEKQRLAIDKAVAQVNYKVSSKLYGNKD